MDRWPVHSFSPETHHRYVHRLKISTSSPRTFLHPYVSIENCKMSFSPMFLRPLARVAAPKAARAATPKFIPALKRPYHPPRTSTLRPQLAHSASQLRPFAFTVRYESTDAKTASHPTSSTTAPESRLDRDQVPTYELTITCKPCSTRSSHRISKQGYHHGTILVTCPECKNRHLVSDHLKVRRAQNPQCCMR
jgi:protein import protein ZIM17